MGCQQAGAWPLPCLQTPQTRGAWQQHTSLSKSCSQVLHASCEHMSMIGTMPPPSGPWPAGSGMLNTLVHAIAKAQVYVARDVL